MEQRLSIRVLPGLYSILRFNKAQRELLDYTSCMGTAFACVIYLEGEWTVICESEESTLDVPIEKVEGWRVMRIEESLSFDMIGVIHSVSKVLKDVRISMMAVSTFTTDAFLVREGDVEASVKALESAGFLICDAS